MDAVPDAPPTAPSPHRWRPSPVHLFVGLLLLGMMALVTGPVGHLPTAAPGRPLPWWALVPVFVAGEALVVHLPIASGALTFAFREVPTVIALLVAAPDGLLLASLTGCGLWLVVKDRQRGAKLVFNLASCLLEGCLALLVFHALLGGGVASGPRAWASVFAAVLAADVLSAVLVTVVIALDGGGLEREVLRGALTSGSVGAAANASLAVLGVVVAREQPSALPALAVILAALFAAYRAHGALAARGARAEALHRFVGSIGSSLDLDTTVAEILDGARRVLLAQKAVLALVDARGGAVRIAELAEGDDAPLWTESSAVAMASARPWWASARAGRSVLLAAGTDAPAGGTLAVSLTGERLIGVLAVEGRIFAARPFGRDEQQLLEAVTGHAAAAVQGCDLVEQLRAQAAARAHEASHDALTGLVNRHGLDPALRQLCATSGAVLVVGLTGFEEINTTLGQEAGDAVLCEVGARLAATGLPVARLDGADFAVLVPGARSEDVAAEAAALLDVLQQAAVPVQGADLFVAATVGTSLVPEHGRTPAWQLAHATAARRRAERSGTAVAVHQPDDDLGNRRRLLLAAEIGEALEDGQVVPWFQPKVTPDGTLVGVEALVRWIHPTHGFVPPEEIVIVAERTGRAHRLTERVLELSLVQQRAWAQRGLDLQVAVNSTMTDLHDPDFADTVARLLERTGVPPAQLTVEITEGSMMGDPERCLQVLLQLEALGVHLSVDDFGTGHSSLAYLDRLPVHEVKIDRSFVVRLADSAGSDTVLRATVELGHALGLRVVTEGVETPEMAQTLAEMGVDVLQGYHFGRPQPAAVLDATWWPEPVGIGAQV